MNYVKGIIITLILFVASPHLSAQMPEWLWAHGAGAAHTDVGQAITVDSEGFIYSTGRFSDTVSFGPLSLTSIGSEDIYVAKHDSNGNWLWAQRAGGVYGDVGQDIAVDSEGNVYITGYFAQTADFGSTNLVCSNRTEIFVAKLDPEGNWLWARQADGPYENSSFGIALDAMANVYITGYFASTTAFGTIDLVSTGVSDIFVAKLDTGGNWLWVRQAGGITRDLARDIAVDSLGKIYVTGYFFNTCNFGSLSLTGAGYEDIFVACMDSSANWLWASSAGGSSSEGGNGIAIDSSGSILLVGSTYGAASFGSINLPGLGSIDAFVAKLDNAGNWLWAVQSGGALEEYAQSVVIDTDGNCYVAGVFNGAVSFGSTSLINNGQDDIFVAKLDADGNWLWADRAGGELNDGVSGLAVDGFANLYLSGWYTGNIAFGPHSLSGFGSRDIFIAKLGSEVHNEDALFSPSLSRASINAYPNPFNDTTSLSLASVDDKPLQLSAASLIIYDVKGRRIRTLHTPEPNNAEFQVTWDGRDDSGRLCSSGVYLAKLYANGQSVCVKRLSLVN